MASKLFPHVFTPGRIGTLELKNRVMKAPQSVSYTHLDVYKRQVQYCFLSAPPEEVAQKFPLPFFYM